MKPRQSDTTRIMIATAQLVLAQEIMSRSKEKWGKVPIQYDVYSDHEMIVHQAQSQKYSVVLLQDNIPGIERDELAAKIAKMSSSIQIQNFDRIENWNEFFGKVLQNLPDDLISRYQLGQRNTELYEQLSQFAIGKYGKTELGLAENWIGSIPGFFLEAERHGEAQAALLQNGDVAASNPDGSLNETVTASWQRPGFKTMKADGLAVLAAFVLALVSSVFSDRSQVLHAIEPLFWGGTAVLLLGLSVNWTLRGFRQ